MKKIIILTFLLLFSIISFAELAPMPISDSDYCPEGRNRIVSNELPCVINRDGVCNYLDLKNTCDEEVLYTDLECWDDSFSYDEGDINAGFSHKYENEITLSKKTFSAPRLSETTDYNGVINYGGGAWLPCKLTGDFYNPETKEMTIKLRKGNEIYTIVAYMGKNAPNKIGYTTRIMQDLKAKVIIWSILLGFIGINFLIYLGVKRIEIKSSYKTIILVFIWGLEIYLILWWVRNIFSFG